MLHDYSKTLNTILENVKKNVGMYLFLKENKNLTFCQCLVFVNTTMVKAGPRAHQLTETKKLLHCRKKCSPIFALHPSALEI